MFESGRGERPIMRWTEGGMPIKIFWRKIIDLLEKEGRAGREFTISFLQR